MPGRMKHSQQRVAAQHSAANASKTHASPPVPKHGAPSWRETNKEARESQGPTTGFQNRDFESVAHLTGDRAGSSPDFPGSGWMVSRVRASDTDTALRRTEKSHLSLPYMLHLCHIPKLIYVRTAAPRPSAIASAHT